MMLYLKRWVNNEYRVGDKTKDINQARPTIREKSEKKLLNGGGTGHMTCGRVKRFTRLSCLETENVRNGT